MLCAALLSTTGSGCVTARGSKSPQPEPPQIGSPAAKNEEPRTENAAPTVQALQEKISILENQVVALNEKLIAAQSSIEAMNLAKRPNAARGTVMDSVGAGAGKPVEATQSVDASGFVEDAPIQKLRDALILFEGKRFGDAAAHFADFLKEHADHTLAGTAQYFLAESYFGIQEKKLALQEFQRVLVSYDRSSYVAETLRRLAELEDAMNLADDARRHRQQLQALFPMSPAATFDAPAQPADRAPDSAPQALDAPPIPTASLPAENESTSEIYSAMDSAMNMGAQ